MNKKKSNILLILIIFSISLYARDNRNTSIPAYFYSLLSSEYNIPLNIKNAELMPVAPFEIKRKTAVFFANTFWTFEHGAIRLIDYLYLEYLGYFDSYCFYDATADSGKWVDLFFLDNKDGFVIVRPEIISEKEKLITEISAELSEFERLYAENDVNGNQNSASEQKKELYENGDFYSQKEKSIRDSEYNIAFFSFEKEYFGTQNLPESKILIRGDDENMFRIYYDDDLRIIKKENWKMAADIKGSELLTTQLYKYENSSIPVSSVLSGKDYRYEMSYDEKGNVIESKNYKVSEEDSYIESISRWRFNQDNKIKMKESTVYTYKSGNAKAVLSKETKREEYEYKVDSKTPDYFYYENGELRLKKIYTNADDYITSTYFDGGFVVESYYSNYNRIKDIFYLNGKVKRIKKYAQ